MIIGEVANLITYGSFGGGAIGNLLAQWQAAGIFDYALPFLLIFALVFGLLSKLNIFGSKGDDKSGKTINTIIALASALMALQFDIVSVFFSEIFPRLGIALSIILVLLILGGIFMPTNKESNWFMVVVSIIAFLIIVVVVYGSFQNLGLGGIGGGQIGFFLRQYAGILIFFAIIIIAVVITNRKPDPKKPRITNILSKALGED